MMYNAFMRQSTSLEEQLAAKAAHQAAVLARREERKAATRARNELKAKQLLEQKRADIAARQEAWKKEREQRAIDFKASLSEQEWEDLQLAAQNPNTPWLESVINQFKSSGYLSANQVRPILEGAKKQRALAARAEGWKELVVGEKTRALCTVVSATAEKGDYGTFYRIRLLTHYGRAFMFTTTREPWFQLASDKQEAGKKVAVHGTVKWIAPNKGGTVILTGRGMHFGELV
jgi:hypothetical protein